MVDSKVTPEYLESNGFKLKEMTDGSYYVKYYHSEYFLQVELPIGSEFTEFSDGWVEHLTEEEFTDTIDRHNKAISQ